jgi:stearoyl-CoA desaturase (delta-9 desaturase)
VRDLAADPLVRFQHRHYLALAFIMGAVLPGALGSLWGDTIGVLLVGGCLRVVLQWHATFSVNSIAHMVGRQPYTTAVSARDSWFTALITLGEGYHNYHHRFPLDYRERDLLVSIRSDEMVHLDGRQTAPRSGGCGVCRPKSRGAYAGA